MKKFTIIIITLLIILGGALWFIGSGPLNDFVKVQIEKVGSDVTHQTVKVKSVDIQLTKGLGAINNFQLSNPDNYKASDLFSVDNITLDINLASLTSSPIIIDEIKIISPAAFVEFTKTGGSNIKELLDNIKSNATPAPKSNEPENEKSPSSPQDEPKILIKKFSLIATNLTVDLSALGNKEHQVTLSDIILENIGGSEGMPASQLGAEMSSQMLKAIYKQAKKTQTEELKNKAKAKVSEKLSELFK